MYSSFELIQDGAVAEIRLNRPEKRNALDVPFWQEFPEALEKIDANPAIRALILTGTGKHFSAGMDFDFFETVYAQKNNEEGRFREWLRREILRLQSAVSRLEDIRVPVIAAIQGACVGGALDLVCAANIRIATENAFFTVHEINVGMTADLGTLQRLPKLIPPGIVQDLALTGRPLSAERALAYGFVSKLEASSEAVYIRARAIADLIAEKSPLAVAGTKVALTHARDHTVLEGLNHIANWNAAMFIGEDIPLGFKAQADNENPIYKDTLPL
jgi:enoyl-CoA hydratase/carnithine racemase